MTTFDTYSTKYQTIRMERHDGILQLRGSRLAANHAVHRAPNRRDARSHPLGRSGAADEPAQHRGAGAALGIPAVNGDTTHNFFNESGSGGLSSLYQVVERLGDRVTGTPESIALAGGTIVCTGPDCVITGVSEPASMALLGVGLLGLGIVNRNRRRDRSDEPAA